MILARQTAEAGERFHDAIVKGAERYRDGTEIAIAIPAFMVTAMKR